MLRGGLATPATGANDPMKSPCVAPYGAWKSPITADLITGGSIAFTQVALDGGDVYWGEQRPAEGGRNAIVRRTADGAIADVIPREFSARSRVHEYGGGAFAVRDGTIWFCNDADQRVWMVEPGGAPRPLTPEGATRHADFAVDAVRRRLVCVCEDHGGAGEPENLLVAVSFEGGVTPLRRGADFYAAPCLSPDGLQLAWAPSCGWPILPKTGRQRTRGASPAGPMNRSSSRNGRRTARCISSPTALAGGVFIAAPAIRPSKSPSQAVCPKPAGRSGNSA
jgi:hypothetical protein